MLNSLNEPTRCRNHSRAMKIGQRTWNRNALCSKGVPCLSRIRKRIRPASESSIPCLWRAKLTRAPLTTERSEAIASSSRTKPWSRTGMLFSGITSAVTATRARLSPLSDVVRQAYGIAGDQLTPLAGGYSNQLWRAGDLVVRVESAPPESVAWEHGLVRFLAACAEEVVAPVETVE